MTTGECRQVSLDQLKWISGFFIIVTNAWMQHPVGYRLLPNGVYEVSSFTQLLLNPWAWLEYAHNMCAAVVRVGLAWWCVGMCLALMYFVVVYWLFRGKVPTDAEGYGH